MGDKVAKNLFAFCVVSFILLALSVSIQEWRICRVRKGVYPYYRDVCARDGLFEYCTGYCIAQSFVSELKCRPIPWNVWHIKTETHQSVIILIFVCIGLHFLSCVTGIISALTFRYQLMLLSSLIDFIAGICGIAGMSVYTQQYNHSWCSFRWPYVFGWVGAIEVLISSLFFFAMYGKLNMVCETSERTALINTDTKKGNVI